MSGGILSSRVVYWTLSICLTFFLLTYQQLYMVFFRELPLSILWNLDITFHLDKLPLWSYMDWGKASSIENSTSVHFDNIMNTA